MKKIVYCVILCLTLLFVIGTVAGATVANKEIMAYLNYAVNIKLNGKDFTPLDEDGTPIQPITYNGRTYLPVRALANALSIAVDYDNVTQTVLLGEKDRVPLTSNDFEKNYTCQFTTDANLLNVNNEEYEWGIVYTGTDGSYEYSGFIFPNGQYQKFGGVACFQDNDGSTSEVIIKIRENDYQGRVLKEIKLKKGESQDFEIDVPQIKKLYIQNLVIDRVPKNTNPDIMMIAEPYFK